MHGELSVVFGYLLMVTGVYWTFFNRPIARRAVINQREAFRIRPMRGHVLVNRLVCGLGGLTFFMLGLMSATGVISLL